MTQKKIVIAGGSGFIGQELVKYFGPGNQVVVLSRGGGARNNAIAQNSEDAFSNVQTKHWDGRDIGAWSEEINGADLVINLAGKSVNCRYNAKNKKEIFDSRTDATQAIGKAIRLATSPPKLWINAASATIYRHAKDRPQDEFTGEFHDDFSVQVCKRWEETFFAERSHFTRKVALRLAITLGDGGVMVPYLNLCKFGLGGKQGDGSQMYSWVHVDDLCRVVDWLWDHPQAEGVYNVSAPNPVTNEMFMNTLRKVCGHRFGLPAPAWMLRLGAAIIGTEAELLLKSRWVLPTRLQQEGFTFKYPLLKDAVAELLTRFPRKRYHLF